MSSRQMKIVYIIDKLTGQIGGTENQLIKLINGIDKDRFQVHLICLSNTKWIQDNASIFKCDITVFRICNFHKQSTYINLLRLKEFIQDYETDIVHTFFPVANIMGVIAARLAGMKNIVSSRRDYGEWMNRRYLLMTNIANRFVKKIIANSNSVRALTEEKENVVNGKVEVILNGIDIMSFSNIERDYHLKEKLNIPDHDKVVGIIANYKPMKHHYTFIKAAHEIVKFRKDISFLLVGGTNATLPMMKKMEELGETLNIRSKLFFTGPQENVIPYLSIMDMGINCSEKEGMSNAVMEYMAAEIPCIVSNSGGNPDLITNDINGYLFELDDYKTLASLVPKLLDDEVTRARFVKNERERVEKEMSLGAMIANYENLYQRLLENDKD